jgi:hypothetical protein
VASHSVIRSISQATRACIVYKVNSAANHTRIGSFGDNASTNAVPLSADQLLNE